MTPVHSAADGGNITVVQMLLDKGARADLVDNVSTIHYIIILLYVIDTQRNRTLLHFAAGGGCIDIVELLIKQGTIDINALDKVNN